MKWFSAIRGLFIARNNFEFLLLAVAKPEKKQ